MPRVFVSSIWLNISSHKISNKKVGKKSTVYFCELWIVFDQILKRPIKIGLPNHSENWHFRAKKRLCAYKSAVKCMLYLKQFPNSF